jgi:hypothetical protein
MTDYDVDAVSKIIVESRILKQEDENRHRVGVTLHACVLIFCVNRKMSTSRYGRKMTLS